MVVYFLYHYSFFALALLALLHFLTSVYRHAQKSGNTLITDITA